MGHYNIVTCFLLNFIFIKKFKLGYDPVFILRLNFDICLTLNDIPGWEGLSPCMCTLHSLHLYHDTHCQTSHTHHQTLYNNQNQT